MCLLLCKPHTFFLSFCSSQLFQDNIGQKQLQKTYLLIDFRGNILIHSSFSIKYVLCVCMCSYMCVCVRVCVLSYVFEWQYVYGSLYDKLYENYFFPFLSSVHLILKSTFTYLTKILHIFISFSMYMFLNYYAAYIKWEGSSEK